MKLFYSPLNTYLWMMGIAFALHPPAQAAPPSPASIELLRFSGLPSEQFVEHYQKIRSASKVLQCFYYLHHLDPAPLDLEGGVTTLQLRSIQRCTALRKMLNEAGRANSPSFVTQPLQSKLHQEHAYQLRLAELEENDLNLTTEAFHWSLQTLVAVLGYVRPSEPLDSPYYSEDFSQESESSEDEAFYDLPEEERPLLSSPTDAGDPQTDLPSPEGDPTEHVKEVQSALLRMGTYYPMPSPTASASPPAGLSGISQPQEPLNLEAFWIVLDYTKSLRKQGVYRLGKNLGELHFELPHRPAYLRNPKLSPEAILLQIHTLEQKLPKHLQAQPAELELMVHYLQGVAEALSARNNRGRPSSLPLAFKIQERSPLAEDKRGLRISHFLATQASFLIQQSHECVLVQLLAWLAQNPPSYSASALTPSTALEGYLDHRLFAEHVCLTLLVLCQDEDSQPLQLQGRALPLALRKSKLVLEFCPAFLKTLSEKQSKARPQF